MDWFSCALKILIPFNTGRLFWNDGERKILKEALSRTWNNVETCIGPDKFQNGRNAEKSAGPEQLLTDPPEDFACLLSMPYILRSQSEGRISR